MRIGVCCSDPGKFPIIKKSGYCKRFLLLTAENRSAGIPQNMEGFDNEGIVLYIGLPLQPV